ncbi:hypothetical protein ACJX0J_025407, partial [Zea mays]
KHVWIAILIPLDGAKKVQLLILIKTNFLNIHLMVQQVSSHPLMPWDPLVQYPSYHIWDQGGVMILGFAHNEQQHKVYMDIVANGHKPHGRTFYLVPLDDCPTTIEKTCGLLIFQLLFCGKHEKMTYNDESIALFALYKRRTLTTTFFIKEQLDNYIHIMIGHPFIILKGQILIVFIIEHRIFLKNSRNICVCYFRKK